MNSFERVNRSALSELIVHRKIHIISMILLGIAGFTYTCTSMSSEGYLDIYEMSMIFYFLALIPLFFVCVNVFREMHDVPSADVQMAMPLSASERFLSRMLTICYIWIFPFIFFDFTGNILSVIINSLNESRYFTPAPMSEMFAENLKIFLWALSISMFITASVVLCVCCIGSKAESIYLPAIMMIVVSVLPFETQAFISHKFADISARGKELDFLHIFGFGAVFYDVDYISSVFMVLLNCLISLAMTFLAMFAYKKRDAVTVGYPVVFRMFFEAIVICSLAALFQSAHSGNYGVSVIAMFVFFIGALILRMIVSRKDITLSKIAVWSGMFAAYYAVFIMVSYIMCVTGGFGYSQTKPDTSDLVERNVTVQYVYYRGGEYNYGYEPVKREFTLSNEEEVVKICSKYCRIQDKTKGFFSAVMFSGVDGSSDKFRLFNVYISGRCNPNSEYKSELYSARLYLDRDTAAAMCRELDALR